MKCVPELIQEDRHENSAENTDTHIMMTDIILSNPGSPAARDETTESNGNKSDPDAMMTEIVPCNHGSPVAKSAQKVIESPDISAPEKETTENEQRKVKKGGEKPDWLIEIIGNVSGSGSGNVFRKIPKEKICYYFAELVSRAIS